MRYAMIMAGGAGTRLWPMSRKGLPKQLIPFIRPGAVGAGGSGAGGEAGGGAPKSLLGIAAGRLEGLVPPGQRYICTAEAYREAIRRDLPAFADAQILGEPVGRDTVNAVGLAAAVLEKEDKDAVFAVLTADHLIEPLEVFRARMDLGFRLVEADARRLVTFSIQPTYAATGFGYVERGTPVRGVEGVEGLAFHVARFVEKPDLPRAEAYVRSGHFGWNSGMFVWKASTVMAALKQFKPESHAGLVEIQKAWGTKEQRAVLERVYPRLPKISVDYALMEPASRLTGEGKALSVCTVLMDLKWLDVGSWPAFAETVPADGDGNRVSAPEGSVLLEGCEGTLVVSEEGAGEGSQPHLIALLGTQDLIVVRTARATLIMPRDRAEELKVLHGRVPPALQ